MLPDRAWTQATLRPKDGGLGLRACVPHLEAAYVSACNAVAREEGLDSIESIPWAADAVSCFAARHHNYVVINPASQKEYSDIVDAARYSSILEGTVGRDKGRLLQVHGQDAGAFWNVVPSENLGLALPAAHFRVITLWWLGVPIYAEGHRKCWRCGKDNDAYGHHALVCRTGGLSSVRHNALRNVVCNSARFAEPTEGAGFGSRFFPKARGPPPPIAPPLLRLRSHVPTSGSFSGAHAARGVRSGNIRH